MELKGLTAINSAIDSWLIKNNFTCRVRGIDTDFFWYHNDDTIGYSLLITQDGLDTWEEFLCSLGANFILDSFYTFLLHEVFHSETYHTLSEEEIDESEKMKTLIEKDPNSFEDIYKIYYNLPVEIIATQEMVNYVNSHHREVQELVRTVSIAINNFYELNEIEI